MRLYTCTDKHYTNSKIDYYLLKDLRSNKELVVSAQELKQAMINKTADVMNLQLTSDNRLVEAGKEKMQLVMNAAEAPDLCADNIRPLNTKEVERVEALMDKILHECMQYYVKEHKKYVKLEHFNKENNTCILEFTLGPNSFFTFRYDKKCYGMLENYDYGSRALVFEVFIHAIGVADKKESIKINTDKYEKQLFRVCVDSKGNIDMDSTNSSMKKLACALLRYTGEVVMELCQTNERFIPNASVEQYEKHDENIKDALMNIGLPFGIGLGGAVLVAGAVAVFVGLNPDMLQTALLAKIAEAASPGAALAAISGGVGGLSGIAVTLDMLGDDLDDLEKGISTLKDEARNGVKNVKKTRKNITQQNNTKGEIKSKGIFSMFSR